MERIKKIYGIEEIIVSDKIDKMRIILVPISINNREEYWSYWDNVK